MECSDELCVIRITLICARESSGNWPFAAWAGALAATIYTGAVPMALGTAAWFALVKMLPTQVAALSSIAIPIVAIVSVIVLLDEPLSALQAVAIASTVVSLWLALMPPRRQP